MDLSSELSWLFVAIGVALALLAGYKMRGPKQFGDVIVAGVLAIALGVVLCVAASFMHTACIESFRLCASSGDQNLSVWLRSLIAAPAYWICLLAFVTQPKS